VPLPPSPTSLSSRLQINLLREEAAGTGAALHRTTARLHESERCAAAAQSSAAAAANAESCEDARRAAILSESCRALALGEESALPSAVKKLVLAVGVLKQMERWVRDVCAVVGVDAAVVVGRPAVGTPPQPPVSPKQVRLHVYIYVYIDVDIYIYIYSGCATSARWWASTPPYIYICIYRYK